MTPLPIEGQRELLLVIDEESDRLNRFIEGLSTSDRAEPAQPLHLRAVDVESLIRASLARADTLTRDHRLAVTVDEGLPLLSVDAARSSRRCTSSWTTPASTRRSARRSASPPRCTTTVHVRIAVSDEGPGIPSALREQVFERFFRVPARESHDPRRGGVGLGLSICRRLSGDAGGTGVDGSDGVGARHAGPDDPADCGRRAGYRTSGAGRRSQHR